MELEVRVLFEKGEVIFMVAKEETFRLTPSNWLPRTADYVTRMVAGPSNGHLSNVIML